MAILQEQQYSCCIFKHSGLFFFEDWSLVFPILWVCKPRLGCITIQQYALDIRRRSIGQTKVKNSAIEQYDISQGQRWSDQIRKHIFVIITGSTMLGSKLQIVRPVKESSASNQFIKRYSRCKYINIMGGMTIKSFEQMTAVSMYRLVSSPRETDNTTNLCVRLCVNGSHNQQTMSNSSNKLVFPLFK